MFQLPSFVLSLLIATLIVGLFFAWQGKTLRQLAIYWVAGVLGFLAGQWLAILLGWRFLAVGQLHPAEGLALCAGALFLVKFLRI